MSNQFYFKQFSIWPIDKTLSDATTPGQSGPGSKKVLRIPQIFNITGASSSDCLVLYPGYSLGGVLPLCWDAVDVFYILSWLG